MAPKHPKRPRDPNLVGKLIVNLATGETMKIVPAPNNPAAEFARQDGLKGGKAQAEKLTPERRAKIAKDAANSAMAASVTDKLWRNW